VLPLGLVDEDEEVTEDADRDYWLKRAGPATLAMADAFFEKFIRPCDAGLSMKYNRGYIGTIKKNGGAAFNFVCLSPKKSTLSIWVKLPQTDETDERIRTANLDQIGYSKPYQQYRIRLTKEDLDKNTEVLAHLSKAAFEARTA